MEGTDGGARREWVCSDGRTGNRHVKDLGRDHETLVEES